MTERRILVIAPHADDEVLGCGATIAKHAGTGDHAYVLIATNASVGAPELFARESIELVRSEAVQAHKVLGVRETFFLDLPAPCLDTYPSYKVALEISKILRQVSPSVVYLPFPGDIHVDHYCVHRAALVAARPQGDCTVRNIYCYETLSETEWATSHGNSTFAPNCFCDVSDYFERKLDAMQHFGSQLRAYPHPRSLEAIEALAKFRGSTVGVRRAEAFVAERLMF